MFLVHDDLVMTSRLVACPEGITRATVLEICRENELPTAECDISLTTVYSAAEMFCCGTMGELAAVIKVDGRIIGNGCMGKTTERLRAMFGKVTQTSGVQVCE